MLDLHQELLFVLGEGDKPLGTLGGTLVGKVESNPMDAVLQSCCNQLEAELQVVTNSKQPVHR